MSGPLSPGTILLLLAILGVFVPVLQSLRAPPGKLVVPTDQYSKSFKATTDDNHPHRRKDAAGNPPPHHRNGGGFYSQSGGSSSRHDGFRHNNAITDENLQDTLLKSKTTTRDSIRRHHVNAIDSAHLGVRSYRKKYPTPKPRRHFYDNREIGNSISRNPEKYYYSKDIRKHRNRHRPVELPRGHEEENYSHKKTHSFTKPVFPTAEYVPEEVHHQEMDVGGEEVEGIEWGLSNLSEQFDDNDYSDLSNSSFSNDSSVSNSSDSEKSKYSKCPTCQMRDGDRRYRIERLKQTILSKLHMTSPPNASQVTIPKMPAMEKYYGLDDKMMSDSPYTKRNNNDDDFAVRTERVFTKAREPPAKELLNITDSVYFAPPISLYTSKIKTAYLWFYIRKREIRRQPSIHVTIERILPESVPEKRLVTKIIFSTNLEAHRAHGWKRIDLRDTLRRWVTHPMSNHGLRIRALDDEGNNLIVLTPAPEVDRGYEPWLDTKVIEPTSHSRHRRSQALRCTETSPESRCCRYPLYITFAEFGWEWIIAPSRAEADYCSGECHMTMQNVSPIGWIHQQVEMTGVSGSCCSPSKLGSLPLLYFDENYNVVFQVLQGMRVEECGCT